MLVIGIDIFVQSYRYIFINEALYYDSTCDISVNVKDNYDVRIRAIRYNAVANLNLKKKKTKRVMVNLEKNIMCAGKMQHIVRRKKCTKV